MKKIYITPQARLVKLDSDASILQGSGDTMEYGGNDGGNGSAEAKFYLWFNYGSF